MSIKGMIVSIYRNADGSDCSNGGISGRYTRALAIGDGLPAIFEASPDMPVVVLMRGNLRGTAKVVPLSVVKSGAWSMFGGAFIVGGDSRWNEAVNRICGSEQSGVVPLHDRVEG